MTAAADLQRELSQAEFAELVGVSEPKVSQMVAEGMLQPGQTGHQWLLAYTARLREQAAGRDNDLTKSRAALAQAQQVNVSIKNAVLLRTFAPIGQLTAVLANASQMIADRFDAIPGAIKKRHPDVPDEVLAAIEDALATARNEWVEETAGAKLLSTDEGDGDEAEAGGDPLSDPVRP